MRILTTPLLLFCLCLNLVSCVDHQGVSPTNPQRLRLNLVTISGINDTDNSLYRLSYDGSGRLAGLYYNSISRAGGAYVYESQIEYDSQGRISKETAIGALPSSGTAVYTYTYDAMNRLQALSQDKVFSMRLTYDLQNRVIGRTTTYVDRSQPAERTEVFELDNRGNITTYLQTYIVTGSPTQSFRQKIVATYDQVTNPYYGIPSAFLLQTSDLTYLSPNNLMAETVSTTASTSGPFPADARSVTNTVALEYKDGLLIKRTPSRDVRVERFDYKPY